MTWTISYTPKAEVTKNEMTCDTPPQHNKALSANKIAIIL